MWRKHSCQECEQKFTEKSSLIKHLKSVHMGIKYPCQQCDYTVCDNLNQYVVLNNHTIPRHESRGMVWLFKLTTSPRHQNMSMSGPVCYFKVTDWSRLWNCQSCDQYVSLKKQTGHDFKAGTSLLGDTPSPVVFLAA